KLMHSSMINEKERIIKTRGAGSELQCTELLVFPESLDEELFVNSAIANQQKPSQNY
ncbi:hypothetical protein S245_040821, partial [Arachis hypogaea]